MEHVPSENKIRRKRWNIALRVDTRVLGQRSKKKLDTKTKLYCISDSYGQLIDLLGIGAV